MSDIGDIVATRYISTKGKAVSEVIKSSQNSLVSKIKATYESFKLDEFDKETKIDNTISHTKSNYFVFEKAKKIKDSFVNYFQNFVGFDYRKPTPKRKNKNPYTRISKYSIHHDENPVRKAIEMFLRFYFMVSYNEHDQKKKILLGYRWYNHSLNSTSSKIKDI